MFPFNPDLRMYEAKAGEGVIGASDALHISKARLAAPEYINSAITYMAGNAGNYQMQNFPILLEMQGKGRKKSIKSIDLTYRTKMMGHPKTTTTIVKASPGANLGANGAPFTIYTADRLFMKNMQIHSGGVAAPITLRVQDDGKKIGPNIYEYVVKKAGVPTAAGVPASIVAVGTIWATGLVKVSLGDSHGTKHRSWQTPFELKNQLSVFRRSYTIKGNTSNKVLAMPIKVNGKTLNTWTDWEYMNNELQFMVEKNEDLIFSQYNADENGVVHDTDVDTGESAPSGMGLWDAIPNKVEYAVLTEKRLDNFIQERFHSTSAAVGLDGEYIIAGGLGLLRDIDNVLKTTARGFLDLIGEDKFVRATDGGKNNGMLQYGNYFNSYKHYSGKVIRFVYDQAFDKSARAKTSGIHPLTGLPMMSHCGLALDFSNVETKEGIEPNIYMVYEEGREHVEKVVEGMSQLPGKAHSSAAATDVDRSSIHKIATQGIGINNISTCGKFICKKSA